jgi:Tfp pilus assembly protein PilF
MIWHFFFACLTLAISFEKLAACVLLLRVSMKSLATLTSIILLAGINWAACPIPDPSNRAGQESTLETLRHTGLKYSAEGHYRNAAACYEEALHTSQALGISNTAVATDLQNLALLAEEMGDYTDARNYYSRELDLLNRLGDASSVTAGDAYLDLGGLLQVQGSFSDAEIKYKKAVDLFTQHAGAEDLRTAKALDRLGRLYMEWAKFSEASTLLRKARATAEKNLPEDHPKLIAFFDSEAYFLCQTGKYREAEKKWAIALNIAERAYGENEVKYGSLLLHLGQMYSLLGNYPAAETMLQRSLAAKEKTSGSDPVDRAVIMSSLALAYAKHRKLAEAEPLVLKSVEASNTSCSEVPTACAFIRSNLGRYYMVTGHWAAAELEFERALQLREDTLGQHPMVADSLLSLSRALRKLNRKKEARIYETRATEILASQRNPAYDTNNTIDVRSFQANNR